jgi:hypothetical protein
MVNFGFSFKSDVAGKILDGLIDSEVSGFETVVVVS